MTSRPEYPQDVILRFPYPDTDTDTVTQKNFENIKRKIQRIISDNCFQLKWWFNVDARAPSIPLLNLFMKVHLSFFHAPIYNRNFYLCVRKKSVQTLRCWATRESLCANGSVPCTAAETIARTLLASFVLNLGAFPLKQWPSGRVPTFKSLF